MKKFAIVLVGKTHSGKTTFAKKFVSKHSDWQMIETDALAVFLKQEYPNLAKMDIQHKGDFSDPSLKFLLYGTILDYALKKEINVVLSNSNLYAQGRGNVLTKLKQSGYMTIGIFLNLNEEVMSQRIKSLKKDTNVLSVSSSYGEVLIKQRDRLEIPSAQEFDYFFEINDPSKLESCYKKVSKIIGD